MHLKSVLTNITKGTQSITDYMQHAKSIADELAMLDAPENSEDLTVKILNGLGDEFRDISSAVRARDSPITFEELHEKLINSEAVLKQELTRSQKLPITANYAAKPYSSGPQSAYNRQNNNNIRNFNSNRPADPSSTNSRNFTRNPSNGQRPYRGFCQLCGDQGHTAKRCPTYNFTPALPNQQQQPKQWQSHQQQPPHQQQPQKQWVPPPRAHFAASTSSTPEWLLDTGASHHVTADLQNLSMHSPYTGSDDIMIGDDSGLQITHT